MRFTLATPSLATAIARSPTLSFPRPSSLATCWSPIKRPAADSALGPVLLTPFGARAQQAHAMSLVAGTMPGARTANIFNVIRRTVGV